MSETPSASLSRRERQIMDLVYELGQATAAEIMSRLPDPPSYSAVRSSLRLLEDKGHLRHVSDGPRYVYLPTVGRVRASRTAVRHVLRTFFDGSIESAVAALLEVQGPDIDQAELERIVRMIRKAKKEGR